MAIKGRKPGTRKTGGRRKGTPNRATAIAREKRVEIMQKAAEEGVTPLEVMLDNMKFAYQGAGAVLSKIMGTNEGATIDAFVELIRLRQMAQDCAKDAAPYLHPRLASVEFQGDLNVAIVKHEQALDEIGRLAQEGIAKLKALKVSAHG